MAKGQRRSNREIRKPKAVKKKDSEPATVSSLMAKGQPTPIAGNPKTKRGGKHAN